MTDSRPASPPSPFAQAVARSMPRAAWLLGQALNGRPLKLCVSPDCRWSHVEHYYAPDCGPRRVTL